MFSLICTWINGWVNNREAGDLRRRRTHYNVIVMISEPRNLEAMSSRIKTFVSIWILHVCRMSTRDTPNITRWPTRQQCPLRDITKMEKYYPIWQLRYFMRNLVIMHFTVKNNEASVFNDPYMLLTVNTWSPFYWHGITAWVSNCIHYNMWNGITYPFTNFGEWISNFITQLIMF